MSMQEHIAAKLDQAFTPSYLAVENESYMHNVPKGAETHFKVVMSYTGFEGQGLLARHKTVNAALAEELTRIHALSLHLYTPKEWEARQAKAPDSPLCRGGGH